MISGRIGAGGLPGTGGRRRGAVVATIACLVLAGACGAGIALAGVDLRRLAPVAIIAAGIALAIASWMATRVQGPGRTREALAALMLIGPALLLNLNGLRVGGLLSWGDVAVLISTPVAAALAIPRLGDYRAVGPWTLAPAALIAAAGAVSLLAGGDPAEPVLIAFGQLALALVVVPLALGTLAAAGPSGTRILVGGIAVGMCANAGIAFLDSRTNGLFGPTIAGTLVYANRFAGLTTHPNLLGLVGTMTFPVTVVAAVAWRSPVARIALIAATTGSLAAVLASGSRASLIALPAATVGLLVGLSYAGRMRTAARTGVVILVLLVVGGAVALGSTPELAIGFNRITGAVSVAASDEERLVAYGGALDAFVASPILGAGLSALRSASLYLQVLASSGVVGALALVLLVVGTAGALLRGARLASRVDPLLAAVAAGSFGSLIGWLVYGIGQNSFTDRFLYLPGAVAVAALLRLRAHARLAQAANGAEVAVTRSSRQHLAPVRASASPAVQDVGDTLS